MTNTDDQARVKQARQALCHINALDVRKRTRQWDDKAEAALREAEATIAATPGRVLLQALRDMRQGGPQSIDPCPPVLTTNERSERPRRSGDGVYCDASMRSRYS